jgi:tripartite ATP-independent transporter DctM subunit
MELAILIGSFFLFMVVSVPIAFSLLISAMIYLFVTDTPLTIVAQSLSGGVRGFTLLAVPLYILAGELMNSTGITRRIFDFALSIMGHMKGGLGQVNVLASMIFAGISGSSSADAAGLGRVEIQAMREQGYTLEFSGAITAVSSTIGPIIPPSIHLVVFGAIAEQSVDYLFLGGIFPGIIMGLLLMAWVYVRAASGKEICPVRPRADLRVVLRTFARAIPALVAPIIIVGGILTGIFTATEAGVVVVIYALFLGFFYGELTLSGIREALFRSVQTTAIVMFMVSTCKVFSWAITVENVPDLLARYLLSVTSTYWIVILFIAAVLVFMGMFLDVLANLVILTPILIHLAKILNIDLVHLGVFTVLGLMIGVVTPPVGISLYIVSELTGLSFERMSRAVLPYIVPLVIALLVVMYFPDLVLFIPRIYGYKP